MIGLAAAILLTPLSVPDDGHAAQLPLSLSVAVDYLAAIPALHRAGRDLTWTLAIPAHGTARITTTGAAVHRPGALPLDHVTQDGALHQGDQRQLTTTVCDHEDVGPQSCTTGHSTLRPASRSRWERGAAATAGLTGLAAAIFGGIRVWHRRRAASRR